MAQEDAQLGMWRCPGCGYDLSATRDPDGAHCPECGIAFTTTQLLGWADRKAGRAARMQLWILWLPTPAMLLGLVLDGVLRHQLGWWPLGLCAFISFVGVSYGVSTWSLIRSDDAPLPWLTGVPMAMLVMVINISVMAVIGLTVGIGAVILGL